jgi:death on curing protein
LRYLTVDEVIRINESELGTGQLRDRFLLEAAVERPRQSAGGQDAYADIHCKAAALMHSLIGNHPFVDGNKRTAVMAVYLFYGFNGYILEAEQLGLVHLAVDVALGVLDIEKSASYLAEWALPIPDTA